MSCEFEKEIQSRAEFMNQCYVIMGGKNWSKKRSWKWPHFHNNFICLQDWLENHKVSFFNIFQLWIFAPKCLQKEIFFCHFGVEPENSIFFFNFHNFWLFCRSVYFLLHFASFVNSMTGRNSHHSFWNGGSAKKRLGQLTDFLRMNWQVWIYTRAYRLSSSKKSKMKLRWCIKERVARILQNQGLGQIPRKMHFIILEIREF